MTAPADRQSRIGAIVLAGGSGARFGSMKQFVDLVPGTRLLDAAIAAVTDVTDTVVVVMHPDSPRDERDRTTRRWPRTTIVDGGSSRLDSVANGLAALDRLGSPDLVLVHDAAHPLASPQLVERLMSAMTSTAPADAPVSDAPPPDGAVPVLEAVDVVKRVEDDGSTQTVGRQGLGSAQVPMLFRRTALEDAHRDPPGDALEDSAAIESKGGRVVAVAGDVTNIHVVDDDSLALARLIASVQAHPEN